LVSANGHSIENYALSDIDEVSADPGYYHQRQIRRLSSVLSLIFTRLNSLPLGGLIQIQFVSEKMDQQHPRSASRFAHQPTYSINVLISQPLPLAQLANPRRRNERNNRQDQPHQHL
jgi:hypothetical protein